MGSIEMSFKLRPCLVRGEKALFHQWEQYGDVVDASPFIGGHSAGQISRTYGICEFDDGSVRRVEPPFIRFTDGEFQKYCFRKIDKQIKEDAQ